MSRATRFLVGLPAVPLAGLLFALAQVLRAAHRSDLPSFPNQDPSGMFGDPSLPRLRIVVLGDSSITAPGVTRLDNIWVRRVARRWADRYHVELIALAVGGSKAHDVIEGQLAEAVRLAPDVAVVSVGANDALRGVPPASYERRLHRILDDLEAVAPGIVLIGMGDMASVPRLPPALRPYVAWRSRVFNQICVAVAASRPKVIKPYTRGRMSSAFWEDPALFAPDQFHAGDLGHALFAEEIAPSMEAALAAAEAARADVSRRRRGS